MPEALKLGEYVPPPLDIGSARRVNQTRARTHKLSKARRHVPEDSKEGKSREYGRKVLVVISKWATESYGIGNAVPSTSTGELMDTSIDSLNSQPQG